MKDNLNEVMGHDVTIESERISKETGFPVFYDPYFPREMGYNIDMGIIVVNPLKTAERINFVLRMFPRIDWRDYLRSMFNHEIIHKLEVEFLRSYGVSESELREPHYHYAREVLAVNLFSHPVDYAIWRLSVLVAKPDERKSALEKSPDAWIKSALYFNEDEIRELFGPIGFAEPIIEFKRKAEKVTSYKDMIDFAEWIKGLRRWRAWT